MSTAKFNQWLNSDGTENYKCRAWVNFNGTGTVAIRASGNVSSITDNGTGDYTVNFTNAMPDANYSFAGGCAGISTATGDTSSVIGKSSTYLTTSLRINTRDTSAVQDPTVATVAIFR